ncbi:hypothetical protein CTAYLR_004176 [Chrysophaeum taylorii]|uniref:Uncharacterized protein n=1 Tax=Chrysophaeum taylorii TaxID=2483200 RepID=A0AAD7ULR2_9STRA|nr:hypothetical protein CTAYLR_004176 [Chrysophaeum taylorii]
MASRVVGYGLCVSPFVAALGYEAFVSAMPWSERTVPTSAGGVVTRSKRRPPPIGTVTYPAGRILLEWCLRDAGLMRGGDVVEIGAGTGVCAIGLARAVGDARVVVAVDECDESLENLEGNVRANRVSNVRCVRETPSLETVTHVVAADVVYDGAGSLDLDRLLLEGRRAKLVLVDRWSGGWFAAVTGVAGVAAPSSTTDPAIAAFERSLAATVLRVDRPDPGEVAAVRDAVFSTLTPTEAGLWRLLGTFEMMRFYDLRLDDDDDDCRR